MEGRANALSQMKICRFCLSETPPLSNIYEKQQGKEIKQVPLPLQLMACVALEVFQNDGMPQMICKNCRNQTVQAYVFKTNCKKADDALKVFLATGSLLKPDFTRIESQSESVPSPPAPSTSSATSSGASPASKRNLNESSTEASKKRKSDNSEIITLNFSNNFKKQDESDKEQSEQEDDEDEHEQQMDNEDYDMDQDPLDEPNRSNVNQVKTDCFPCPDCERSFPLKQLLELHQKNHVRERNFPCDECDKAFFTKYDLNKHSQTHSNDRPFACVVCNKTFSRESLLHRHEKIHVDVPKYLCTECDRTFLSGEDLDAHNAKQHKKYRPFACKLCNKSFVFKQGLDRHLSCHTNVKPHKCNYCEASFNSAIKLTRHVTSHAGLRPYPCKICGRTFLLSHHLTRHLRSHYAAQASEVLAPLGQFKCDVCSMSFRRKDSLINHSAIHSMVNLKCVICNTEFDNVHKVKEHITTHLSDLPFPCDKCDYSFETQEQLEDHELKHAEMEYEDLIEREVIEEERKKMAARDSMEEDEYDDEEEPTEFTISDLNNPEVVRRSSGRQKRRDYREFLKDELGSDIEEHHLETEDHKLEEEYEDGEVIPEVQKRAVRNEVEEIIKPIVRSEGTKVYARKSLPEKPKRPVVNLEQLKVNQTLPTSMLDVPTTKDIAKMPNKEVFNMKIGDKTVVMQKLLLTKEQIQAMAREGKLEKKGNTFLVKKNANMSLQNINLESVLGDVKPNIINFTSPVRSSLPSFDSSDTLNLDD